jgi:acetyl esterase/lipase
MKKIILLLCTIILAKSVTSQQVQKSDAKIEKTTYTYKHVNGLDIQLDLFRVKDNKTIKPVIVWLHSGALIFGSRNDIQQDQVELYLNSGFSVVSIDYRLAPETPMQDIVSDIKDAISWIRLNGNKTLGIDSNKVFIVGHSAGGYLALMTGYILDTPPQGIVSLYGYGDILGEWYNRPDSFYCTQQLINKNDAYKLVHDKPIASASYQERFNFYMYCRQNGIWTNIVTGIDPHQHPESLVYYCPIKNIHSKYPSTLLIHGNKDTDVPYFQSKNMEQLLAKNGIECRLITMEGYGHVFDFVYGGLKDEKTRDAFNEIIQFLNKHK